MSRTGRGIFITGGSGLFGRELIRHFLGAGWRVVTCTRRPERLKELREVFPQDGFDVFECDLEQEGSSALVANHLSERGLRPHALVHCARNIDYLRLDETGSPTREGWLGEFTLDVVIPWELTRTLAQISGSRLESVVNIGSIYGSGVFKPALYPQGHVSPVQYSICKAAMIHLTREMAVRFAPDIRVNCVSYGGVDGRVNDDFRQRYARLCPQKRMLQAEEIPGPVAFLVGDEAVSMTGQNIQVDGGWTL